MSLYQVCGRAAAAAATRAARAWLTPRSADKATAGWRLGATYHARRRVLPALRPPGYTACGFAAHHPNRTSPGGAARLGAVAAKLSRTPGSRGGHLRGHLRQPDGGTLTMSAAGRGGASPPRPFSATRRAAARRQPSCAVRAGKCSPRRKRIVAKLSRPRRARRKGVIRPGGAALTAWLRVRPRCGRASLPAFAYSALPPGRRAASERAASGALTNDQRARRLFFGAVGLAALRRLTALWSLGSISPSPLPSPGPAGGWGRRQASQTALKNKP